MTKPVAKAEILITDDGVPIEAVHLAGDRGLGFVVAHGFTLNWRWPHVWRPYSVACRPREDGLISLHVKAISGGWVSRALVQHTAPGDELILGPSLGTMTLRAADRKSVV